MTIHTRLLVIGSLNMDVVVRVERHPLPGETLLGSPYQTFTGGKGGNQAVAAARAGGEIQFIGCVGSDGFGSQLLAELQASRVQISGVERVDGPSGIAFIVVDNRGQNSIVVSPGANLHVEPEQLRVLKEANSALSTADILMMQLEIPLETVEEAIGQASARAIPVLLNPAPAQTLSPELLAQVSYLVANENEAALLAGQPANVIGNVRTAVEVAKALVSKGVGTAIVTLGAQGVVWFDGCKAGHVPALSVSVVDTTAAGDAFCGALAVKLGEGAALTEAISFANAAGAVSVTRMGAQASLGDRNEIELLRHSKRAP
ncbi:MAG: ribokinase [Cyanobacteria bacterium P01_E01_bin.34]